VLRVHILLDIIYTIDICIIVAELGWELFHNRADTLRLYEAMMRVGRRHGIINFGMKTLNTMRIEKGFKLWGREVLTLSLSFNFNLILILILI
jgi:glycine cleavage system aminomethyltransferase T